MQIKITIHRLGKGQCSLTGKEKTDGLEVAFEEESPCFLSWQSLKHLLNYRASQNGHSNGDAQPQEQQE